MTRKLFVGNLPFSTTEKELEELFAKHGPVTSAKIITDRETGRPRGFGFVEFSDDAVAEAAINALNGATLFGRAIVVNEAKPQERRGGGGFGGSRDDGGYGGRQEGGFGGRDRGGRGGDRW